MLEHSMFPKTKFVCRLPDDVFRILMWPSFFMMPFTSIRLSVPWGGKPQQNITSGWCSWGKMLPPHFCFRRLRLVSSFSDEILQESYLKNRRLFCRCLRKPLDWNILWTISIKMLPQEWCPFLVMTLRLFFTIHTINPDSAVIPFDFPQHP